MRNSTSIHVLLSVPTTDFEVFAAAAALLKRKLRDRAPDTVSLIVHELRGRKPQAIAEEYLYFIGWFDPKPPRAKPRAGSKPRPSQTRLDQRGVTRRLSVLPRPVDPSRN